MNDNIFVDTNVVIYALDEQSPKNIIAKELLSGRPHLSTQVIMESVNVLIKKFAFSKFEAFEHSKFLIYNSKVVPVTEETILQAADISSRYNYGHWDSLVIASALQANCKTLYSEDFQNGQIIYSALTIRNPFVI